MSEVISKEFEGKAFLFREDGWFNMNKAAVKFGKHMHHFWSNKETSAYCALLVEQLHGIPLNSPWHKENPLGGGFLTQSKRGCHGGTWGHPKLAVFFARWLDPRFAVFCDIVIDDILSKKATVTFTEQAAAPALPQTYLESLQELVKAVAEREALAAQNAQLQATNQKLLPHAEVGQAVGARKRTTVMDFAKKLPGINTMQVQKTLAALGHLRKVDGHWSVYASSKKFFNESFDGMGYSVITATEKGQQLMTRLYLEGEFPMLKGRVPEAIE